MSPQEFIAKWGAPGGHPGPAYHLNEEQDTQSHFLDLCDLFADRRVFHRPHPSPDTDKAAVESIRKWFETHGVKP